MFVLLALAATVAAPPPAPSAAAQATVRILRPVTASEREWKQTPSPRKREIIVKEADGRMTRVRVIEHE